jgi:hypothetical protein
MAQINPQPDDEYLALLIDRAADKLDAPRPLTYGGIRSILDEVVRDAYSLGRNAA